MHVNVKYFNVLQEAVGKKEEQFELPAGADLAGVISLITQKYGQKNVKLLNQETGRIAPYIRIFVDNKLIYDPDYKLQDGAQVSLFFAVVGG